MILIFFLASIFDNFPCSSLCGRDVRRRDVLYVSKSCGRSCVGNSIVVNNYSGTSISICLARKPYLDWISSFCRSWFLDIRRYSTNQFELGMASMLLFFFKIRASSNNLHKTEAVRDEQSGSESPILYQQTGFW